MPDNPDPDPDPIPTPVEEDAGPPETSLGQFGTFLLKQVGSGEYKGDLVLPTESSAGDIIKVGRLAATTANIALRNILKSTENLG
jgi:hypothetical protein